MRLIVLFIAAALFFSCNAEKKHQTSGKQEPNSTPQTQRVDTLFAQIDFPTTMEMEHHAMKSNPSDTIL